MRVSVGTFAVGLLLSAALPVGAARASDPGEQLLLERANYWLAQQRADLAGEILRKILASNPGQPDALYQQGMLAVGQDDRGGAQQYFDRLKLLAASDKRAAELMGMVAQSAATAAAVPAAVAPSAAPPAAAHAPAVAAANPSAAKAAAPATASAPVAAAPNPPPVKIAAAQAASELAVVSADSDDLIPAKPAAPARDPAAPRPQAMTVALGQPPRIPQMAAVAQPTTLSDGDTVIPTPPGPARLAVASAGSPDLGITAREVQVAQVELQPPNPVNAYQPVGALKPYSASDTLETYIDRDLAQLEAQSNPTLIAGIGYREHNGSTGLQSLQEVGGVDQFSFSPWYTGTATIAVLPIYIDAGTPANGNLGNFGANPMLRAAGLSSAGAGDQNASGVGLLGTYSWDDFSGQFGTTPLGFPVTNFVGDVAYVPKFLGGLMSVRFEGLRQPVTDTVISYAGTHANLKTANAISNGAFGTNNLWGGVVKTGPRVSVFYDNQQYGAYGAVGVSWLTGTNVAQNNSVDALLGAYYRPWKWDFGTVRVGVSLFYEGYGKNLSGYTFGQGGYFSPQDFEGLGFPVEFSGSTGPWSYLASTTLGIQHFNADSSAVFPNNPYAQADLVALSPSTASTTAIHSGIDFGFNLKGQLEYAVDKTFSVGVAGSFNNGNNYDEGIVQLYLRKTFDWFVPVAFKNDPESIAARDMPASHL